MLTHSVKPYSRVNENCRGGSIKALLFFIASVFVGLAAARADVPVLLVADRPTVTALETTQGLGLADVLGHPLVASPLYVPVVAAVAADVQAIKARDPKAGVGMNYVHRLFDVRWLTSPNARFELSAVVNRLDRRPFHPDTCGEIRLVYRLSYRQFDDVKGKPLYSRLPMTMNVVFFASQEGGDCRAVAGRWYAREGLSPEASAAWLRSEAGPLGGGRIAIDRLKSVEVNFQSVRWPSTIRPDLGGHAEYVLRVFHRDPSSGRLAPATLENTPDVARLSKDPKALAALKAWIRERERFAAIDAGTATIPEEFLARKAESVSPHGWMRAANRPFSALFEESDFADLDYAQGKRVRSPKGMLRRLDDLSCLGCHQARSVAGFHLLGEDPPQTFAANAIATPFSPHLRGDLPRREASLKRMAETGTAISDRPLSERADGGEGGWGSHCGLGDASFAAWTCAPGLHCAGVHGEAAKNEVGECFHDGMNRVGEPCQRGVARSAADPRADGIAGAKPGACGLGVCEAPGVGFPDGMCAVPCDAGDPDQACGAIAILTDFNACLARNEPFDGCLARNVRPAGLRACGPAAPCRDDYLCARGADGKNTCIPPYFLFQMRVDGHPNPVSPLSKDGLKNALKGIIKP